MKTLLATAALAAIIASPAFAQHHPNIPEYPGLAARAEAPAPSLAGQMPSYTQHPEYDVYVNGVYVGSDPDPRIRETIEQEARGEH
jgi:hypothetical protein